jgi:hypothetical protein
MNYQEFINHEESVGGVGGEGGFFFIPSLEVFDGSFSFFLNLFLNKIVIGRQQKQIFLHDWDFAPQAPFE